MLLHARHTFAMIPVFIWHQCAPYIRQHSSSFCDGSHLAFPVAFAFIFYFFFAVVVVVHTKEAKNSRITIYQMSSEHSVFLCRLHLLNAVLSNNRWHTPKMLRHLADCDYSAHSFLRLSRVSPFVRLFLSVFFFCCCCSCCNTMFFSVAGSQMPCVATLSLLFYHTHYISFRLCTFAYPAL